MIKVRVKEQSLYATLRNGITQFQKDEMPLLGLNSSLEEEVLIRQLIDSIRRIDYVFTLQQRPISSQRMNPNSSLFDPIRAAIHYKDHNYDEACWLVFLFTHFGKPQSTGWRLLADIYGALGDDEYWSWERIRNDIAGFRRWFGNASLQMQRDGITRRFGNHRKYESIRSNASRSLDKVIESYVTWIGYSGQHAVKFGELTDHCSQDPRQSFEAIYQSMRCVLSFGRTARFDYLTMLRKTGFLDVEAPLLFINEATGPLRGARQLFYGNINANVGASALEDKLEILSNSLELERLTKQVLEDALCNWQKSPAHYLYFTG